MRIAIVLAAAVLLTAACSSRQLEKPRTGELSERVGGESGIAKIVDAFHTTVVGDAQLKDRFSGTDARTFKASMTAFLCDKVKASCNYDKSRAKKQIGVSLSGDEFDSFLQLFIVAMNDTELPQKEQNDLIDAMMSMRTEIVKP